MTTSPQPSTKPGQVQYGGRTVGCHNVKAPPHLTSADLDWTGSKPLKLWSVGPNWVEHYNVPGGWRALRIALLELCRQDVWTVLCANAAEAAVDDIARAIIMAPPPCEVPVEGSSTVSGGSKYSTGASLKRCQEWLETTMSESPNKRTKTRTQLRNEARKRFPNLTSVGFDTAWQGAVKQYQSWSLAGAPKGPRSERTE